jgi:hypothetical protein
MRIRVKTILLGLQNLTTHRTKHEEKKIIRIKVNIILLGLENLTCL